MKEYELLVEKIRDPDQEIVQYNSILYTATAAILAFTFEKDSALLCLLPYLVIVPVYLLIQQKRESQHRITAYLIVFLEGTDYRHEKRLYKLWSKDRASSSSKKIGFFTARSHFPAFIATLICAILATYKIVCSICSPLEKRVTLAFIWIVTVIVTIIMICSFIRADYEDICIAKWQAIKMEEEQEARKRNANRNPQ